MTKVTEFDGPVLSEYEEHSPWEYSLELTEKLVEGSLADRVRARVGVDIGTVHSVERNYGSGTCELCGYGSDGIKILVDNMVVFATDQDNAEYSYDESDVVSPYTIFNAWLDGADEGSVGFEPYERPTEEEN